jgi:hypothetical protein
MVTHVNRYSGQIPDLGCGNDSRVTIRTNHLERLSQRPRDGEQDEIANCARKEISSFSHSSPKALAPVDTSSYTKMRASIPVQASVVSLSAA